MAAWIKMPLGMEVGLGPSDFVLDGDPAPPPQKGGGGMEVDLSPGDFVFDGDPATPQKNGTPTPPNFWLMSIVAKRLDG